MAREVRGSKDLDFSFEPPPLEVAPPDPFSPVDLSLLMTADAGSVVVVAREEELMEPSLLALTRRSTTAALAAGWCPVEDMEMSV